MLTRTAYPWLSLLPGLLLFSRALADVTIVLVGLAFIYRSYRLQDWQWFNQTWFRLALLFSAYLALLNAPFSLAPWESFSYALFFLRWPLFAAALAWWLLATRDRQQWFLKGLFVTSMLVAADIAWQYVFGVDWFGIAAFSADRLTGPFRNPVPGTLMLRVWYIAIFALLIWHFSARFSLFACLSVWFIGLVLMFITGERMALMLYSAGGLVLLPALWTAFPARRGMLSAGLLLMGMIALLLMQTQTQTTARSVLSIADKLAAFSSSDYGRVFAGAWQVWQQYFWLGSGLHTYPSACEQLGVFAGQGLSCTHPHNLYLELGAETGLLGLVLFVLMLGAIYRQALTVALRQRCWTHAALSFIVLTVSFWPLSGGISVFSNWIAALVWLGVGWVLAVAARPLPLPSRLITEADH